LESKQEEYRDAWRWEIEYKGDAASDVAGALQEYGNPSQTALAYVWHQYERWGIPPVWGLKATIPAPSRIPNKSDDERRLAWLAVQVAPVVRKLLDRGRRADVLEALGLTEMLGEDSERGSR
jgi:hypothetical protein